LGLRRTRQANDAGAFGPAFLMLDRIQPDHVMINISPDIAIEREKWNDLRAQIDRLVSGCSLSGQETHAAA
jgi:hypothetical protein